MTFIQMIRRVARDLGMLSSDGTTVIEGLITEDDIKSDLNSVLRDILVPLLSDKFPMDFTQTTYPINTYTITGALSNSSNGTTLNATTAVFNNSVEGFEIYNLTDDTSSVVASFTDSDTIEIEDNVANTWDGDTFYILGNEFALQGAAEDCREILEVAVMFNPDSGVYVPCRRVRKQDVLYNLDKYVSSTPVWYPTTIDIGGKPVKGFGIAPAPLYYNGKMQITYMEQHPELVEDTDEPHLSVIGISEPMINGALAKGLRSKQMYVEAEKYEEINPLTRQIIPKGTMGVINTYRPGSRSGARTIRLANWVNNLG